MSLPSSPNPSLHYNSGPFNVAVFNSYCLSGQNRERAFQKSLGKTRIRKEIKVVNTGRKKIVKRKKEVRQPMELSTAQYMYMKRKA